jgi:site-specific recombinase XerD
VKLHLAAIRALFDFFVTGQFVPFNPAALVRGPKHVVRKGKTLILLPADARLLLDSIETDTLIGLRDRALIGVMVYSFARVSAALGMNAADYYLQGRRRWFRLYEKDGKHHEVPVHHRAAEYLDQYLNAAPRSPHSPLFPAVTRYGLLTERRLHRTDSLRMIK